MSPPKHPPCNQLRAEASPARRPRDPHKNPPLPVPHYEGRTHWGTHRVHQYGGGDPLGEPVDPLSTKGEPTSRLCRRARNRRRRSGCRRSRRRGCTALRTRHSSADPACCQIRGTSRSSRPAARMRTADFHCMFRLPFLCCNGNMHRRALVAKHSGCLKIQQEKQHLPRACCLPGSKRLHDRELRMRAGHCGIHDMYIMECATIASSTAT